MFTTTPAKSSNEPAQDEVASKYKERGAYHFDQVGHMHNNRPARAQAMLSNSNGRQADNPGIPAKLCHCKRRRKGSVGFILELSLKQVTRSRMQGLFELPHRMQFTAGLLIA